MFQLTNAHNQTQSIATCLNIDISTPLTIAHYLQAKGGAAVGLNSIPERFISKEISEKLDTVTPIPGLYLTGQDFLLCGQPLCQISGLATAFRIIGFQNSAVLVVKQLALGVQRWFKDLE